MSIEPYVSTQCQYKTGCDNEAIPTTPFCTEHIDEMTALIDKINAKVLKALARNEAILASMATPWYRKPGKWMPILLFIVWIGFTAYYPVMLLWFLIFVPIALFGWHWGMRDSNGRSGNAGAHNAVISPQQSMDIPMEPQHYAVTVRPDPMDTFKGQMQAQNDRIFRQYGGRR